MKYNTDTYFQLYANCILVKGASRSTICDLQKEFYVFIPNNVSDILIELETLKIEEFLYKHNEITKKTLFSYFDYFIEHDLGHFCSNPMFFPKIEGVFKTPKKIEDCIIELSEFNYENISYIIKSLTNLGCSTLELRSFDYFSLEKISNILHLLIESRIRNVEIYLKYTNKISCEKYTSFIEKHPILGLCVIHSCTSSIDSENNRLVFTEEKISTSNCCGKISKDSFVINLPFYLEGIKHNTCLNRKFSISADGSIKNCPSMNNVYGNINTHTIEKIVNSHKFKEYWSINKEMINICKDCEFRKICSDCRAYLTNSFDKPIHCKYNPYTMKYSK